MFPVLDRPTVTAAAMNICRQADSSFARIQQFKAWLDSMLDTDLTTLGFAQADVNSLRSALSDLDQLRTIYQGTTALATAKDFRTFTKLLYPFGSIGF